MSPADKARALAHYSALATEAAVDAHLASRPPVRHLHTGAAAAQVAARIQSVQGLPIEPRQQIADSRVIADAINARNAHTSRRINAGLGVLLALVLGVTAGLLLIRWGTPCDTGHLCAIAMITPTRLPVWQRWAQAARSRYLHIQLRSALLDEAYLVDELNRLPDQLDYTRWHIQHLRTELATLEPTKAPAA